MEKFSGDRVVSQVAADVRSALIEIAGNPAIFDSRSRWLDRAAHRIGISSRMAKAIFYEECIDPKASVVEKIRAAQARKKLSDEELGDVARREFAELSDEVERLKHALRVAAPDAYRAYVDARGGNGGEGDRAVDQVD